VQLSRFEIFKAKVAEWIVVHVAAKISAGAVVAICLETAKLYKQQYENTE